MGLGFVYIACGSVLRFEGWRKSVESSVALLFGQESCLLWYEILIWSSAEPSAFRVLVAVIVWKPWKNWRKTSWTRESMTMSREVQNLRQRKSLLSLFCCYAVGLFFTNSGFNHSLDSIIQFNTCLHRSNLSVVKIVKKKWGRGGAHKFLVCESVVRYPAWICDSPKREEQSLVKLLESW